MGVGDHAGPHRASSRSGRTGSGPPCAAATSSSTRSPSSAARRARPRARRRSTSGSSRPRAGRTRSASRAARSCRRRSTATSSVAGVRRRARRPAGRSGPGPRPGRRLRLAADDPGRDAGGRPAGRGGPAARGRPSQGTVTNGSTGDPRDARGRARPDGGSLSTTSRRAPRRQVDVALVTNAVRPVAVGQGRRPDLLRRPGHARRRHDRPRTSGTRWSTS